MLSGVSGVCRKHHQHIIDKQSLCFSTTTIHGDHLPPCPPTTTSRKHRSTADNHHGTDTSNDKYDAVTPRHHQPAQTTSR
jgi:hypothetical protein